MRCLSIFAAIPPLPHSPAAGLALVHGQDDDRREEGEELHVGRQEPGVPKARPRRNPKQVLHVKEVGPAAADAK